MIYICDVTMMPIHGGSAICGDISCNDMRHIKMGVTGVSINNVFIVLSRIFKRAIIDCPILLTNVSAGAAVVSLQSI